MSHISESHTKPSPGEVQTRCCRDSCPGGHSGAAVPVTPLTPLTRLRSPCSLSLAPYTHSSQPLQSITMGGRGMGGFWNPLDSSKPAAQLCYC